MLGRFLRWWGGELAALLPRGGGGRADAGQWLIVDLSGTRVRALLDGPRPRVLVDLPEEQQPMLETALTEAAAVLDPRRVRVRVLLAEPDVLGRELELPLAAEENLREVLAFEMTRRTPFRPEDVHFDYQVLARDASAQRLRVHLNVVPRARIAAVTAALRGWNLQPAQAAARGTRERPGGPPTFAFQGAGFQQGPGKRLNVALLALAVVLAAVAVWIPIKEQRDYRDALQEQLDAARAEAQSVIALREQLSAARRAAALITDARAGRLGMVELLEELTRALPDGTYLFRLEIGSGEVNLHGSSEAASALIGILEATPHLKGVRFASPVTRDGGSARERFHIVAGLESAGPVVGKRG